MNHGFYRNSIVSLPLGYALLKAVWDRLAQSCDYEFLEVNPKFENMTGLHSSDIVGCRFANAMVSITGNQSSWLSLLDNVVMNETTLEHDIYIPALERWYHLTAYCPEKDYIIVLFSDITNEKSAYKTSTERVEKLKNYLDTAPLGFIVASANGKLLKANAEACRISGYSEEVLRSHNLQRFVASTSRIFALMFFKELLSCGQAESQLQIKKSDGELIWLNVKAKKHSADRLILYCQDISSYKDMEDDLVESELLYRTFIDASDNLIYLKDENLRYKIVNDALLDQFGCEHNDIIGKTDAETLPDFFAAQLRASDTHAIETKSSSVSEVAVDGKVFEAVKFPVSIGKSKTGVGAYIRDITEEKRQEAILKRTMERHRVLANILLMTFQTGDDQLEYALKEALKLTGSQYGYIFSYDEDRHQLTLSHWTAGVLDAENENTDKIVCELEQAGLWGEVIRTRKPILINDYKKASSLRKGALSNHIKIRRYMSIPLILNGRVVSAIGLANKSNDYDEFDVDELTMLMTGVWIAAERHNVQKKVENLLAQTQAMFNEHDAIMLLTELDSGRIIDANPAALTFYGYSNEELLSLSFGDITDQTAELAEVGMYYSDTKHRFFSTPHRLKNGDRRIVDVYSCPITYKNEKVLFSIIFDVTEREEAFDEIKYLSFHDHLTGLFNRRYFDNVLKLMNDEKFMPLTIVMADVNGLKLVNDSFGHTEGDALLSKAAELIAAGCRSDDVCARIGGDEFVFILPNTDSVDAAKIVKRIKKMQSKIRVHQLDLSMSFGYAVKRDVSSDIELIFSEAENNMYKNKAHESASTRNKTVNIIMKTLHEKCEGELSHSDRVSKIATAIATEMHLSSEQVHQVGIAGFLHDIGKIGVDDAVLNKTGLYTSSDKEEIVKHAESGWRILSNSDEYSNLADYVLYHHENIDGKGYPRGIKGESIPLESRIIAVSDAYDAMTNDRAYRPALTKQQAIEELQKFSGTQFDPAVVDIFIQKILTAELYADI